MAEWSQKCPWVLTKHGSVPCLYPPHDRWKVYRQIRKTGLSLVSLFLSSIDFSLPAILVSQVNSWKYDDPVVASTHIIKNDV